MKDLLCKNYYKTPSKKQENTVNGYFFTGDLGKLDEDGYLYYEGRKKDIIITGGMNVYPQDIENKILEIDGIKEVAAFPYSDERLGEVVAIAVVKENDSEVTKKKIRGVCAKKLADFQQPHKIFFLKELPHN